MSKLSNKSPVLSVSNLCIDFQTDAGTVRAVDDVSFSVERGETLGIVGESGCGKTVTCLSLLGLLPSPPGRIAAGEIHLNDRNIVGMNDRELRTVRGREIAMIFQEPMTALNPVFSIDSQLCEVIQRHKKLSRKQARRHAIELLDVVGIPAPEKRLSDYPHQLSGGMRQRVMIAMALSCEPDVLVADEPTTALDVTTQAQVLEQIVKVQEQFGMAVILITHDLGVVAQACKSVMVMYCGKVVEKAATTRLFAAPAHPYTRGLLASVPRIRDRRLDRLPVIEGMVPDPAALPPGCRFNNRCEFVREECIKAPPPLLPTQASDAALVACYRDGELP